MAENLNGIELSVKYWREEFNNLRPNLSNHWISEVCDFDSSWNNMQGISILKSVRDGRASLVKTMNAVSVLKRLIKSKNPSASPTKAEKVLSNTGIDYQPKYDTTKKLKEKFEQSKR